MKHLPRRRLAVLGLAAALLVLLLGCLLAARVQAARPGGRPLRLDSPVLGQHTYSIWVLPCDAIIPGQIVIGRDLWLYSRYPPPGLTIPLAPICP